MAKMREDEIDRRIENKAATIDEYQASFTLADWPDCPQEDYPQDDDYCFLCFLEESARLAPTEPVGLTLDDKIALRSFVAQLESGSSFVAREFLLAMQQRAKAQDPPYWSLAHFEEIARMSPVALARLAMILVKGYLEASEQEPEPEPEPCFRAVTEPRRAVVVEVRKVRERRFIRVTPNSMRHSATSLPPR